MPQAFNLKGQRVSFLVVGPGHSGAGRIRTVPHQENISSPIHEYRGGVMRISPLEETTGGGSRWLDDLYAEEGNLRGAQLYAEFMEQAAKGRAGGEFPEDLLPAKVCEWRKAKRVMSQPFDIRARAQELADGDTPSGPATAKPDGHAVDEVAEALSRAVQDDAPAARPSGRRQAPKIPVMIDIPESGTDV